MTATRPSAVSSSPAAVANEWARRCLAASNPIRTSGQDRPGAATARGLAALVRALPSVESVSWWSVARYRTTTGEHAKAGAPEVPGALFTIRVVSRSGGIVLLHVGGKPGAPTVRAEIRRMPESEIEPARTEDAPLISAADPRVVHVNNADVAIVRNGDGVSVHEYLGGDHLLPRPLAWFRDEETAREWASFRSFHGR